MQLKEIQLIKEFKNKKLIILLWEQGVAGSNLDFQLALNSLLKQAKGWSRRS